MERKEPWDLQKMGCAHKKMHCFMVFCFYQTEIAGRSYLQHMQILTFVSKKSGKAQLLSGYVMA